MWLSPAGKTGRHQNALAQQCFFPPSLHPATAAAQPGVGQHRRHVSAAHRDCPMLTMRTLSLGSSSARLSSSSTTSQFSSPHLAKRKGLQPRWPHAEPTAPEASREWAALLSSSISAPEIWIKVARGVRRAQAVPQSPHSTPHPAPQHPRSREASALGTYSLTKCCASSLVRKTLAPQVSADTRLTSRTQSPRLSASTLLREMPRWGQGPAPLPPGVPAQTPPPSSKQGVPPRSAPLPVALSTHGLPGLGGQTCQEEFSPAVPGDSN